VRCRVQRSSAAAGASKSCKCLRSSPADLPARGGSRCKKIAPAVAGASYAASSASLFLSRAAEMAWANTGALATQIMRRPRRRSRVKLRFLPESQALADSKIQCRWRLFSRRNPFWPQKLRGRAREIRAAQRSSRVAQHFHSTAQHASDRTRPRVASVRAVETKKAPNGPTQKITARDAKDAKTSQRSTTQR